MLDWFPTYLLRRYRLTQLAPSNRTSSCAGCATSAGRCWGRTPTCRLHPPTAPSVNCSTRYTYYGCTYHGCTYHGSTHLLWRSLYFPWLALLTYCGSRYTYYGCTYHGSTYCGSRSTYYGCTFTRAALGQEDRWAAARRARAGEQRRTRTLTLSLPLPLTLPLTLTLSLTLNLPLTRSARTTSAPSRGSR